MGDFCRSHRIIWFMSGNQVAVGCARCEYIEAYFVSIDVPGDRARMEASRAQYAQWRKKRHKYPPDIGATLAHYDRLKSREAG